MKKGPMAEKLVAEYLRSCGFSAAERRVAGARRDKADIAGITNQLGEPVAVEVKDEQRMSLAEWIDEAERERLNAGAVFAIVAHKRVGRGAKSVADWYVTMTLHTAAALMMTQGIADWDHSKFPAVAVVPGLQVQQNGSASQPRAVGALLAERDQLLRQRDSAILERDRLLHERDWLQDRLAEAEGERDELQQSLDNEMPRPREEYEKGAR